MFTRRDSRFRLASVSLITLTLSGAFAAGCGDDAPSMTGGSGGSGGSGGATDVRPDVPDVRTDGGDGAGGDTGTGDVPEGGRECYNVTFDQPLNNATLVAADDKDGSMCVGGFQYDIKISSTDAPDGVAVAVYAGNSMLATTTFTAGKATFAGVQLSSMGDTVLSIQFPSTRMCTAAASMSKVTVDCKVPSCTLAKPVISGAHPMLNGVPAPAGDRANAVGSAFQTAFEVTTDIEDGRPVQLRINNAATPAMITMVSANAMGGKATFAGVTLAPDATYEVVAVCTALSGTAGTSMKGTYTVDTTAPDLTVSRPANGDFIGPTDLTAGKFKVCAKTTSMDAINLAASLGTRAANFCIANTTNCVAVTALNTDACVDVTCPGGTPFNIDVSLGDTAGNTVSKTITGVACASTLPTVQIVAPVSDAPTFTDRSKHILAANATGGAGQAKDLDGVAPGAQANVVACSDRAGSARLYVGRKGDATLNQLGAAVMTAAAATGECPSGLGFVAKFNGVTLPESTNNASGMLATATELRVDLTDVSTAVGTSGLLDLWVDSVAPVISVMSPAMLCGSFQQAPTVYTTDVKLNTDTPSVDLTVTNGASTDTYANPTVAANVATFTSVVFNPGSNAVAALATDPAGNSTTLTPSPCAVTVGAAPVVLFTTPVAGNNLCPNGVVIPGCIGDTDTGTTGWQGPIAVRVTSAGMPIVGNTVTFTIGATTLGTAMTNAAGDAQLVIATNVIPEGSVTLTATSAPVPGNGVGVGTVTVNVDTAAPMTPSNFTAMVLDRRQTSFQLTWTAAADAGGGNVAGYDVRVAKVPIDSSNFDNTSITTAVTYTGSPAAGGQMDGIAVRDMAIEQDYYFAVAAKDAVGSRSGLLATTTPTRAIFNAVTLTGATGDKFGFDINGEGDFGRPQGLGFVNDGLSDLIVSGNTTTRVYLFFGTAGGFATVPSITFTGTVNGFGNAVADAGDLDGDGLNDIAIASPNDGDGKIFIYSRKNPPASWNTSGAWPAALTEAQANYVITVSDPTLTAKMFRRTLARLGDFDGTGADDLAIGFPLFGTVAPVATNLGKVLIVKGSSTFASMTIPNPANAIEIDGTVPTAAFGARTLGIGRFFPTGGPAVAVSAYVTSTAYAFRGQAPVGILTAAMADDSTIGTMGETYGQTLGLLGPLGASPGAISVGAPLAKYVDVHLGTVATGPFLGANGGAPASSVRFINPASGNSFGAVNFGSGVRGTSQTVSIIGSDALPDLIVAGQTETGSPLYVVSGALIPTLSGTVDVSSPPAAISGAIAPPIVKVSNKLPLDWIGYSIGTVIPDSNNDGYADFAVGELTTTTAGRVVVLY